MNNGESIQVLPFSALDEKFKDQIRDNIRSAEDFVPYNWYEDELDYLIEKYGDQVEIDKKSIDFDLDRNDFNWRGVVDYKSPANKKFIPKKFYEFLDSEILYDVSGEFRNHEMLEDYVVDINGIYSYITETVFGKGRDKIDFVDGLGEADVECLPFLKNALNTYAKDSPYITAVLTKWINAINASEIFFQPTFTIVKEDFDEILNDLSYDMEREIEEFMDGEFYDTMNDFVSNLFDEYTRKLKELYDYHFSDEYVDGMVEDLEFKVYVDEDGTQLELESLYGE